MAGKNCIWYSKAAFLVLSATLGVRVASLIMLCLFAVPGDKNIMVATIPEGMELTVLAWIAGIALVVCVGAFIWRYAEYNAAKGETRETNKVSPKFIGAVILALAASIYVAYFLAAPLVDLFHIVEPVIADYVTLGGLAAIIASIGFVVLFSEGFNGLAKFVSQGVKAAKAGGEDLLAELESLKAELAAAKERAEDDFPKRD